MQDNEPIPAAESDPPIIIHGGGSVDIDVPANFYDTGTGKKFKNDKVNLVSLQIDEEEPIALKKNSKITIICE